MREIKFRAWNKEKKEMIDADCLAFEEHEPLKDQLANCEYLMQYTGLKDRNGKEIYEGDIVKLVKIENNYCAKFDDINTDTYQYYVVFYSMSWYAVGNSNVSYDISDFISDQYNICLEVIGNIYENPELLNNG